MLWVLGAPITHRLANIGKTDESDVNKAFNWPQLSEADLKELDEFSADLG